MFWRGTAARPSLPILYFIRESSECSLAMNGADCLAGAALIRLPPDNEVKPIMKRSLMVVIFAILTAAVLTDAQEPSNPSVAPHARMAAAHSVFLRTAGGSAIPL